MRSKICVTTDNERSLVKSQAKVQMVKKVWSDHGWSISSGPVGECHYRLFMLLFNPSLSTVLVIILCCTLGRRARRGSRHQKVPSDGGYVEAELSMKMPPMEPDVEESAKGGDYVPMFSVHSGDGEGYTMQNLATGEGEKESSP